MSSEVRLKLDPERVREMPMVDLAFEILKSTNSPMYYRDLIMEVARIRGLSEDQINEVIAQIYTEINIDGRFACVGANVWGLKRWYPVDKSEDPAIAGSAKRPRIINDDDDDDEDLFADEEEETYVADEEDYDIYDEDGEDIFDESEEEAEVDEEVAIDEEEMEDEGDSEDSEAEEEEAFGDADAEDDDR